MKLQQHDAHVRTFENGLLFEPLVGVCLWKLYMQQKWWLTCSIYDPRIEEFYRKNPYTNGVGFENPTPSYLEKKVRAEIANDQICENLASKLVRAVKRRLFGNRWSENLKKTRDV